MAAPPSPKYPGVPFPATVVMIEVMTVPVAVAVNEGVIVAPEVCVAVGMAAVGDGVLVMVAVHVEVGVDVGILTQSGETATAYFLVQAGKKAVMAANNSKQRNADFFIITISDIQSWKFVRIDIPDT